MYIVQQLYYNYRYHNIQTSDKPPTCCGHLQGGILFCVNHGLDEVSHNLHVLVCKCEGTNHSKHHGKGRMFCSSKCPVLWGYTIWEDITGNHLWKVQPKINTIMFAYSKMCRVWGPVHLISRSVLMYLFRSNTINVLNPPLYATCFHCPWASSVIKVHNLKPKWPCVKGILQFVRSHQFYNCHNIGL